MSFNLRQIRSGRDQGVKYSLMAMVFFALYLALVKIPASKIGWFWQPYAYTFSFIILMAYGLHRKKISELVIKQNNIFPIVVATTLTLGANFAYNIGVLNGFVSVIGPISGAQVALFVILAQIFFRESWEFYYLAFDFSA